MSQGHQYISHQEQTLFHEANDIVARNIKHLGISKLHLDFSPPPQLRVRHAALGEPKTAIAVIANSPDFIGLPKPGRVGVLGHEYGHKYYPPRVIGQPASKHEELLADYFAGYVLGRCWYSTRDYKTFLERTIQFRTGGSYSSLENSFDVIRKGYLRGIFRLSP